jgi:hypothetical protein
MLVVVGLYIWFVVDPSRFEESGFGLIAVSVDVIGFLHLSIVDKPLYLAIDDTLWRRLLCDKFNRGMFVLVFFSVFSTFIVFFVLKSAVLVPLSPVVLLFGSMFKHYRRFKEMSPPPSIISNEHSSRSASQQEEKVRARGSKSVSEGDQERG